MGSTELIPNANYEQSNDLVNRLLLQDFNNFKNFIDYFFSPQNTADKNISENDPRFYGLGSLILFIRANDRNISKNDQRFDVSGYLSQNVYQPNGQNAQQEEIINSLKSLWERVKKEFGELKDRNPEGNSDLLFVYSLFFCCQNDIEGAEFTDKSNLIGRLLGEHEEGRGT